MTKRQELDYKLRCAFEDFVGINYEYGDFSSLITIFWKGIPEYCIELIITNYQISSDGNYYYKYYAYFHGDKEYDDVSGATWTKNNFKEWSRILKDGNLDCAEYLVKMVSDAAWEYTPKIVRKPNNV